MQGMRHNRKPIASLLVLALAVFCNVWSPAQAALVTTNEIVKQAENDLAREKVNLFLERADVRQQMINLGVDPDLAKMRVASLTDQEITQIADQIDELPAGGGLIETLLIVGLVIFVVLLITDILGLTNVYRFVN
jgi:hypothetical protein